MKENQTPHRDLAIALVSGGMDSLVSLAMAHQQHKHLACLHLSYEQRTQLKELQCFKQIAHHYKIPKEFQKIVNISFLKEMGGSSLTDRQMAVQPYSADSREIPTSYVPFRNTHILSIAVSWAEVIGAQKIYIGAVFEDSSGYPDCRPDYYKAFNHLIKEGSKDGHIKVITPVIHMRKEEIVKKAVQLKAPLHYSWSCYERNEKACGVCDSCVLRLRGFQKAGIKDPIPYA